MTIYDYIQMVAGFILGVFYIPSIYRLWKAKTTNELSLSGWLFLLVGLCGMLANATHLFITLGAWSYFLAEVINVFFCLVFVLELIYFRYFYKKI
jgi:uncharacterized protein with PQ loop repeat